MDGVAVPAFKTVAIEQRQEQLEVLFLAGVRGRGHEQQVPRDPTKQTAEVVALCRLQLCAEVVGGHAVCLIDDDEVVVRVLQGAAQLLGARKLCLLYTSDAADDLLCVDLGGRRIIKKKT